MITAAQDNARCARIVQTRVAHGGSADRCPTCVRANDNPFVRRVAGEIVEGCVDAAHHSYSNQAAFGSYAVWFHRQAARQIRKAGEVQL